MVNSCLVMISGDSIVINNCYTMMVSWFSAMLVFSSGEERLTVLGSGWSWSTLVSGTDGGKWWCMIGGNNHKITKNDGDSVTKQVGLWWLPVVVSIINNWMTWFTLVVVAHPGCCRLTLAAPGHPSPATCPGPALSTWRVRSAHLGDSIAVGERNGGRRNMVTSREWLRDD